MRGACKPACSATSTKCALNGIPEGFPRGMGFTLRVETPCPKALTIGAPNRAMHVRLVKPPRLIDSEPTLPRLVLDSMDRLLERHLQRCRFHGPPASAQADRRDESVRQLVHAG